MNNIYLSSSSFKNTTYSDALSVFKKLKIFNVELSYNKYEKHQLTKILKIKNLFRFQIHNYFPNDKSPFFLNLASSDKNIVFRSIDKVVKNIKNAKIFGTSYVSLHAGFLFDIGPNKNYFNLQKYSTGMKIFKKNIVKLSKTAKKYNVKLLIENNVLTKKNLNFFKFNPLLLTDPDEIISFFKWAPSNVRLILDTGHFKVNSRTLGFNKINGLKKILPYVDAYQISENNSVNDENKPINLNSWFMPYIKNNYAAFYTLELDIKYKKIFKRQINLLSNYLYKS